jgi:Spy/CpxP family protein refolding chaperone
LFPAPDAGPEFCRYYRVKYYFGINQVLTAEQREQVKKDLQQALN